MKLNDAFPSNYLTAQDVKNAGGKLTVQIEGVQMEELGQDDEKKSKPVATLQGYEKGLVLNVTNYNAIAAVFGSDESNDWQGGSIVLCTRKVEFKGKITDSIRVDIEASEAIQPVQEAPRPTGRPVVRPSRPAPQQNRNPRPIVSDNDGGGTEVDPFA